MVVVAGALALQVPPPACLSDPRDHIITQEGVMVECECGREFKDSRARSVHLYYGCPAAITDAFMDGESIVALGNRFRKDYPEVLEGVIRAEIIRRRNRRA